MMRAPLMVLLQIVRDNWCKPPQPVLKGPCQQQHNNNTALCMCVCVCVWGGGGLFVLHLLPQGGSRRKVTHPASPAYKCRSLLAQAPLAPRHDSLVRFFPRTCNLSQGHNSPAAQIFTKAATCSFVTYHPVWHGNPVGNLWCGEDQPWLQRGHEDSASRRPPGTLSKQTHYIFMVTQDVNPRGEQSCWQSSTVMSVFVYFFFSPACR